MNKEEFLKIEDLYYGEYCKYLQKKYGKPSAPYFTNNYSRVSRISRTSEGLFIHHIKEDSAMMLSNPTYAREAPFEYQMPENLVYCDYLEHLLLHVKICEASFDHPERIKESLALVGAGGIFDYIIPDLNDIYSGYKTHTEWRKPIIERIINDKETYLLIMDRFIKYFCVPLKIDLDLLVMSKHAPLGKWDYKKDFELIAVIGRKYCEYSEYFEEYKKKKRLKK